MGTDRETSTRAIRRYYRTIDDAAYRELSSLLNPGFRQYRPDRTIDGREAFVRFMRDERPRTDTIHEIHDIFYRVDDGRHGSLAIAARGSLLASDGNRIISFVDVHAFDDAGLIELLWTYTR